MGSNQKRLLGAFAIALAFATHAQAESQYVISNISATSDRTSGIALNGSEFVMSGSGSGSSPFMEAAGYNLSTFTQDWTWKNTISAQNFGSAVAVDSLGHVLVVGSIYFPGTKPTDNFAIARLYQQSPGVYALDSSFTSASCASGYPAGFCNSKLGSNTNSAAYGAVVDSSNRVVAAGSSGTSTTFNFAIARYTSSAALDTSFGGTGFIVTSMPSYPSSNINALTQDASGNLVAAGSANNGNNACIARYTGSGAGLDSSLVGGHGAVSPVAGTVCIPNSVLGASSSTVLNGVTVDSAGNIVVTGTMLPTTGHKVALVARFTSTGALDATFGPTGAGFITVQATTTLHNVGKGVQIDPVTNEVVVSGWVGGTAGQKWLIARVSPNGSAVNSANLFTLPGSGTQNEATGLIMVPGGALMSGSSDSPTHGKWNFAAALY